MSTTATPEIKIKAAAGNLFMKDVAPLQPDAEGNARSMGVLHVQTEDTVLRITDFSRQHENLVEGRPVKLVYSEVTKPEGERVVTYRNLNSAVQPEA